MTDNTGGPTGHEGDTVSTARNVGVMGPPEPQGYELVTNRDVGLDAAPDAPYDPFGNGTKVYACPECGATWNADDLHLLECPRLNRPTSEEPVCD